MSQILDRLSRLEERFQAHEKTSSVLSPVSVINSEKTLLKKDEQIYSLLKAVIDPEVFMGAVVSCFTEE